MSEKEQHVESSSNSQVKSRLISFVTLSGTLLLLAPTVLSLAARWHWTFDLLTSFHVHYLFLLAPFMVLAVFLKRWVCASLLTIGLLYNLYLVVPVYITSRPVAVDGDGVRILIANVWSKNRQYERFNHLVSESDPDIIVVMEVNAEWADVLRQQRDAYPHQELMARSDNFGIALLSRIPLRQAEVLELGERRLPSLFVKAKLPAEQELSLLATHPLPPAGSAAKLRNQQLVAAADFISSIKGPKVLCGDLNLTPWSPYWYDLLHHSELRDSRPGFGNQPTWPRKLPRMARMPIDHVLVSEQVSVVKRKIGKNIGSDHLPVIVDLKVNDEGR